MIYQWLCKYCGVKGANVLIVVWYVILLLLVVLTLDLQPGRFRYLHW